MDAKKVTRCVAVLGASTSIMDSLMQADIERYLAVTVPSDHLHQYAEFAAYDAADFSATLRGSASILGFTTSLPAGSTESSIRSAALVAPRRVRIAVEAPTYSGICKTMQTKLRYSMLVTMDDVLTIVVYAKSASLGLLERGT
eukprot:829739-Pyramimonas_sp.AAC.1